MKVVSDDGNVYIFLLTAVAYFVFCQSKYVMAFLPEENSGWNLSSKCQCLPIRTTEWSALYRVLTGNIVTNTDFFFYSLCYLNDVFERWSSCSYHLSRFKDDSQMGIINITPYIRDLKHISRKYYFSTHVWYEIKHLM